ncbi:MAG: DUF938 domain-containing protein, partial [Gammaproteobacteria bacterium]|nr:DUF938 domain-containing protein [Gammaproteobacteria bacterium]
MIWFRHPASPNTYSSHSNDESVMIKYQPHDRPFAESSEQNKQVILEVIQPLLREAKNLLEIASGTGQHALYFAQTMTHLSWQPSDLKASLSGISSWIADSIHQNIRSPLALDVSSDPWPNEQFDAVFTANSFHIMNTQNVEDLFRNLSTVIKPNG